MIKIGTQIKVSDNSGAKLVKCIKILGKVRKNYADIGDYIKITVKKCKKKKSSKVELGELYKAIVLNVKKPHKRKDGTIIKFDTNSVVLLNAKNELLGTRVMDVATYDIRKKGILKLLSLSSANI